MQHTVADVLNYEILKNASVLSGKEVLSERFVQWISVIEMPVENFVRKNEVVLTTAIGCSNDVESLRSFVQDIIDSEASALMIALGRYIFDVPAEIIEMAEEKGFVIIELPWEVRFSNIVEEVMSDLNDVQQKDRKKSEIVQQELLKLILDEADLHQISKYIQEKIDCRIIITDSAGVIQEKRGHTPDFLRKWYEFVQAGNFPERKEKAVADHDPMFQKFQIVEAEDRIFLQLPVLQVSADPQGYLFVLLPVESTVSSYLTPYRVTVLEHAATTISLWISRRNAIEETKLSLRGDFVYELAKGEFISMDQANSRSKLLGYNLNLPYVCIVGLPENLEELFEKRKQDYDAFPQWFKSMIHYIEEEIYYAAQSLKREVMMTYQGGRLLIFLEIPCITEFETALNFLDLAERRLRNLLPEVVLSWGIGSHREGYKGLAESYQNANLALDIGRRKKGKGNRMLYEDTRVDRILLNLTQNDELKKIITATIDPILQYDQQRNMDLINTFSAYNKYHGNVSQTARALSLHRQSLLYRLRKIESLTNLSLIDPDDLFLLDLSIKTWKLGVSEELT
ncbi:PucR family transcriptional regulator [Planococcus salinarum]|uniref:PucR family transcriptional regulator n=1 Tax=Planococcus salinarum TaxID=622695 RepID=UPI000E3C141C|nr:PucR family transcriptional regulator [Planococcus salinarum]TAA73086.1 PucR family transcriptional regulator [Planococcus salinarum]